MGKISEVVFDIETLACPHGAFDEKELISMCATAGDDPAEVLHRMSLAPLTARILAVAMLNPGTGRGKVWYEHPGGGPAQTGDGLVEMIPAAEEEMLTEFWTAVTRFQRLITFNGRLFDCPFLMLRSALLGVAPSRNLIPYRFSAREHCDLLDQLTFYGAMRKFTLEAYLRGFGIGRPGGDPERPDVSRLVDEGRHREIAEHAAGTVRATAELYRRWEGSLSFIRGAD
jgi:DNA polymerase elongation subunit (family B)